MQKMGSGERRTNGLARVLCGLVALAAGIVGVLMLLAPDSTDLYFSWGLAPPALAALVGAFYVASAVVFGWAAARERWVGQRGLCIAVFGLTLPTLAATIRHHDVFDFGRWQAVGWVVLFVASPILFGIALVRGGRPQPRAASCWRPWARAMLAAMAVSYGGIAVLLWFAPRLVSSDGPIAAGPMGIRFVSAWAAFLALLALYAVVRTSWEGVRVPLLGLVAWPVAGLAASLIRLDDLRQGGVRATYLLLQAVLAAVAVAVATAGRDHPRHQPTVSRSTAIRAGGETRTPTPCGTGT